MLENPLSRRQERLAPLRGTESLILGSGCGGLGPPFWGQVCLSSPDWPELAPSKEDCPGHTREGQVFPGDAAPSPTALRPLPTAPVLPEDPQDGPPVPFHLVSCPSRHGCSSSVSNLTNQYNPSSSETPGTGSHTAVSRSPEPLGAGPAPRGSRRSCTCPCLVQLPGLASDPQHSWTRRPAALVSAAMPTVAPSVSPRCPQFP